MRAITLTGMCWAYCSAASTTVTPGSMSPIASRRCRHSVRISGSHGSICRGANGGSSSRRAKAWNGGSLVIGGAPPIGGSASIVDVLTTTARLVKWSVS